LQAYLLNASNRVSRVTAKQELESFFAKGWEDIVEASGDETDDESQKQSSSKSKPPPRKQISKGRHWFSESLSEQLTPGQEPEDYLKRLMKAMTDWAAAPLIPGELAKLPGGNLLLRTAWEWKAIDVKSRSKQLPPVAQAAIAEYCAINHYRKRLMDLPAAKRLRIAFTEAVNRCLKPENVLGNNGKMVIRQ
jgi:hypothetical protein